LAEIDAHLREGALDADPRLADGGLGEAHELEARDAARDLDLDANEVGVEPEERGAERSGEHGPPHSDRRAISSSRKRSLLWSRQVSGTISGVSRTPVSRHRQAVRCGSSSRFLMSVSMLSAFAFGHTVDAMLGLPYSTSKTALLACKNGLKESHSSYWRHCSSSSKSKYETSWPAFPGS